MQTTKHDLFLRCWIAELEYQEVMYRTSNGGMHTIADYKGIRVDIWPTTGTIRVEAGAARPRGPSALFATYIDYARTRYEECLQAKAEEAK